jgi:hypothetical protein
MAVHLPFYGNRYASSQVNKSVFSAMRVHAISPTLISPDISLKFPEDWGTDRALRIEHLVILFVPGGLLFLHTCDVCCVDLAQA